MRSDSVKWICEKCEKPCVIEADEADSDLPTWCPWALYPTDEKDWADWKVRPIQVGDVTKHGKVKWIDPIGDGEDLVRVGYVGVKDDTPTISEDDFDPVNHPQHYCAGRRYEPWDVIIDWKLDYLTGTALKYISRAGRKDPSKEIEDLRKSIAYMNKRIELLEKEVKG